MIYQTMDISKPEDPRAKSNRYCKGTRAKFAQDQFDFAFTQFLIDDNYVGEPPHVQVSITNLNDNIDENFLKKDLAKLGKIRTLEIIRHPRTGQHLGLAKVQFEQVSVARSCVENFNKKFMMGRQLSVFLDLRFENIELIKSAKLNPRPAPPPPQMPQPQSMQSLPVLAIPAPNLPPNTTLQPQHIDPHQAILPLHQSHAAKSNQSAPIPSPLSSDYPVTTPNSMVSSSTATSDSHRGRLEDRIAKLMKIPNCVLSTIVAPTLPQASPTYSTLIMSENNHDHLSSSHHHSSSESQQSKTLDRIRAELNNHRRPENNNHSNHYQNHRDSYHSYDRDNHKPDHYSENNSDDEWNRLPKEQKPEPLKIQLNEAQIEMEVLPYCYEEFYRELSSNLMETIFKKLRENHGYAVIEQAQNAFKARQDKIKMQQDKERMMRQQQREFERYYMSKSRVEKIVEAPKQRVVVIRQRATDSSTQDNLRPDRSTSIRQSRSKSSSTSSRSSTRSSSSSCSSSSSNSSSSSSSGSSSSSVSSRSSSPSSSSIDSDDSFSPDELETIASFKSEDTKSDFFGGVSKTSTSVVTAKGEDVEIANLLLDLQRAKPSNDNYAKNLVSQMDDLADESVKPANARGRKRKKKLEITGVASEYRAAKRFATDSSGVMGSYDENIENAMIDDENLAEEIPEEKFKFPERSEAEKARMLDDLFGTLSEEDLDYLRIVHLKENDKTNTDVEIPFGSENANKAHLNMKKHMIEGKAAEGHPKWWRGCSRCDVIEVSEKEKVEDEEMNYEDLTKAPIKSHVIQAAANSSRRDLRGDQRRIAVLNPNLDPDVLKMYTTSTLKMRAKNLRFSRSKIHKWGLFACEKIASGDAVIEYVGEKIRPSLADHREKIVYTNLPTHDGSSYFFRVDYDVIDATLKGNKARFINHSCNPNCIAKVIKHDNGSNSIVIYAKQPIKEDEEITYDYKFPREETDQKICCNCRAPNCQKFLN